MAAISLVAGGAALLAGPANATGAASTCVGKHWVGVWSSSQAVAEGASYSEQTLRLVVHPSFRGRRVRVRLSNRFGAGPVTFGSASIARRLEGASLEPGTVRRLSFGGRDGVTVAAGEQVASDPVRLRFGRFEDLAVSVHVSGVSPDASRHPLANQTSYVSAAGSGDLTARRSGAPFGEKLAGWPFLTDVEARVRRRVGALAAVGDSITDGLDSTADLNRRWPDFLARRLRGRRLAVQNAGISGNRVLRDSPPVFPGGPRIFGPSLLHRLRRDVIERHGVGTAIVLAGTNDLDDNLPEAPLASAGDVIGGLKEVVRRLRRSGIRPILATQTPAGDFPFGTHGSPESVAARNRINRWIRSRGLPFADFDRAIRDPESPGELLPAFDSGDHLHPNDAGMRALARAVELKSLRGPRCR